ncbi:hypothetical protein MPER_10660 [Moniliophthora perniciosa FA553]|nr:hypothetical protein MPER_10660 [Moniliophthora perniciosa FA553]
MQHGDCNAPSTFQRIMVYAFRNYIGVFVYVYLDDIFVFSDTIEEHQHHLKLVFDRLRNLHLYLKAAKLDLYSMAMDCLGHLIDDKGLHADADKLDIIRKWREPRDYHDIQKFLGVVNYLATYLPGVASFTSPLSDMSKNKQPFLWRPIHNACMQNIQDLCCEGNIPVLRPINPKIDEPIWVICDASVSGIGAMYGQGPIWQKCPSAGIMSKKFPDAQRNYPQTLAIVEALLKWEDKLIGYKIHVVTDHESLQFFKTQKRLSGRQMRWMEYLSRFDFDITYIKDLPLGRKTELGHMLEQAYTLRRSPRIQEKQEKRDIEAIELEANQPGPSGDSGELNVTTPPPHHFDPTVIDFLASGPNLQEHVYGQDESFLSDIKTFYKSDPTFSKF